MRRSLLLVVGAAIGATIGFVAAAAMGVQFDAYAQVDAGPPASLAVPADQANRFVQAQILTIADPASRQEVAKSLGLAGDPNIQANQVGLTDIARVTASSPVAHDAIALANETAQLYVQKRKDTASAEADRQLAGLARRLEANSTALAALPPLDGSAVQQAQRAALTTEYADLVQQQGDVLRTKDTLNATDRIVSLATEQQLTSTPSRPLAIGLGLLIGLFAALAIEVVLVRREPSHSSRLSRLLGA